MLMKVEDKMSQVATFKNKTKVERHSAALSRNESGSDEPDTIAGVPQIDANEKRTTSRLAEDQTIKAKAVVQNSVSMFSLCDEVNIIIGYIIKHTYS